MTQVAIALLVDTDTGAVLTTCTHLDPEVLFHRDGPCPPPGPKYVVEFDAVCVHCGAGIDLSDDGAGNPEWVTSSGSFDGQTGYAQHECPDHNGGHEPGGKR